MESSFFDFIKLYQTEEGDIQKMGGEFFLGKLWYSGQITYLSVYLYCESYYRSQLEITKWVRATQNIFVEYELVNFKLIIFFILKFIKQNKK